MNVFLSSEIEQFVSQMVASGKYDSPSEVIQDGLFLLKEKEQLQRLRLEELRKEIGIGLEQIERGECTVYDENSLKELLMEIRVPAQQKPAETGAASPP
jgi:antitoxin ParD1/3/4